jgi:hypothetical protein
MAKVYIFTDETDAIEYGGELMDEYLSNVFEDQIFIMSEDNKFLFETEDGNAFLVQEHF